MKHEEALRGQAIQDLQRGQQTLGSVLPMAVIMSRSLTVPVMDGALRKHCTHMHKSCFRTHEVCFWSQAQVMFPVRNTVPTVNVH